MDDLYTLTCPKCGHVDPTGKEPLEASIFQCGECGTRIAYGHVVPRIVVSPEENVIALVLDGIRYTIDKPMAKLLAANLVSVL